jgi:hypothetical protein
LYDLQVYPDAPFDDDWLLNQSYLVFATVCFGSGSYASGKHDFLIQVHLSIDLASGEKMACKMIHIGNDEHRVKKKSIVLREVFENGFMI